MVVELDSYGAILTSAEAKLFCPSRRELNSKMEEIGNLYHFVVTFALDGGEGADFKWADAVLEIFSRGCSSDTRDHDYLLRRFAFNAAPRV